MSRLSHRKESTVKAKIAVLAGDGVGREIVPEAVKVLKVVAEKIWTLV